VHGGNAQDVESPRAQKVLDVVVDVGETVQVGVIGDALERQRQPGSAGEKQAQAVG